MHPRCGGWGLTDLGAADLCLPGREGQRGRLADAIARCRARRRQMRSCNSASFPLVASACRSHLRRSKAQVRARPRPWSLSAWCCSWPAAAGLRTDPRSRRLPLAPLTESRPPLNSQVGTFDDQPWGRLRDRGQGAANPRTRTRSFVERHATRQVIDRREKAIP